jgi:hypothetical protein
MLNFPTDTKVTLTFHCDPAHGWLQVPRAMLHGVGLLPQCFSRYSYQSLDGAVFYLEEDCDVLRFLRAYGAKHGTVPVIVDKYSDRDSFVRRLPRII